MRIKQISVFLPNQRGTLADLTELLAANQIDIRAISVFDTEEFGILRLIVDDPERCVEILKTEGLVAKISQALAIEPEDSPGTLNRIFRLLADGGINIEYIYSYVMRKTEMPYIVLKLDQQEKGVQVLTEAGVKGMQENVHPSV